MALTVGDVMTHHVTTVTPEMDISEAAEKLTANRITGMPVLDQTGHLVGLVSEFDIIAKSGRTVAEIMTRSVISVTPHTALEEATHILTGERIRRLPVMEGGRLVGIISRSDIVRRIATRWTCSVCGSFERGPQPPERCHTCGAAVHDFVLQREPAGM